MFIGKTQKWEESTRLVGGLVGAERFPDTVEYPHHCRGKCEADVLGHTNSMCILAMLKQAASYCKAPREIPGADLLLMATARRTGVTDAAVTYWWMIGASFQSGNHAAAQTFMRCLTIDSPGEPLPEKAKLRVEREPLAIVEGQPTSPFEQQAAPHKLYDE